MTNPHQSISAGNASDQIAALESKVKSLRTELRDCENLLRDAQVSASGLSIGDIVRLKRTEKRFRISRIEPQLYGKIWLMGNPERRDGTFGTAERHLFSDWERVEP